MKKGYKFTAYDYFVRNWVSKSDRLKLNTKGKISRLTGNNKKKAISYLGAKCSICGDSNRNHLIIHHLKQVCDGGTNIKNNCVCLCYNCHSDVHYA